MNYNPNAGVRNRKWETYAPRGGATQGSGPRKMLRVSDQSAMGGATQAAGNSSYMAPSSGPAMLDPMLNANPGGMNANTNNAGFGAPNAPMGNFNQGASMPNAAMGNFNTGASMPNAPMGNFSQGANIPMQQPPNYGYGQNIPNPAAPQQPFPNMSTAPQTAYSGAQPGSQTQPQFAMFQQPIVQDMAMQYGQRLADQGKQMMENQFEKWVPVAKLKYYFAVDNKYVVNKLRLLFFPFLHKDWSLKYDQENPVQPRYDINAPDLYIPTMAYITYVVVAGLMLIMQNRFTPEQLGIQASSALAYSIFELVVYSITLYVVNIKTNMKTLDLLAFSGYKFVIIVSSLLMSTLFHGFGYYLALIYSSFTLGLFLLRTLKTKVLNDSTPAAAGGAINYDPYGNPQQLDYSGGRKRKLYFLFLIVGGQTFLSWLLSKHLYFPDLATLEANDFKF